MEYKILLFIIQMMIAGISFAQTTTQNKSNHLQRIDFNSQITNNLSGISDKELNVDSIIYMAENSEEPEIQPDFAFGKWYKEEYILEIHHLYDWDADNDGRKLSRGFSRNYFSSDETASVRLLKKDYNSHHFQNVECTWYIDGECINSDNPKHDLSFAMNAGAYKIEARQNDTTLISFTARFIDKPEVVFKPHKNYDGEYGYDDNCYDNIAQANNAFPIDSETKYIVPYMSIIKGQTALLDACVMYDRNKITGNDSINHEFEIISSSPHLKVMDAGRNIDGDKNKLNYKLSDFVDGKITFQVKAEDVFEEEYIEIVHKGNVVGKINVESNITLPPFRMILVKVNVNDRLGNNIDINKEKESIESLLNTRSFNQAFIQWNIVETKQLNLKINKDKVSLRDIYREAVKYFKANNLNPYNYAVMFIADSDVKNDANGYAYVTTNDKDKYSIVHVNALNGKTPVHELSHNLGLLDLNNEFKSYLYDTNNFMDYYSVHGQDNRQMFWRHQWKKIYKLMKEKINTISLKQYEYISEK